jgi:anti-anti-sigma factor
MGVPRYSPQLMENAMLEMEKVAGTNGHNVTLLRGKLSLETVHDFIQAMRQEPAAHLVLDMSGVSFLDSSGVGALVSLFVSRRHASKTMALAGLTKQGVAVMQVSGLTKLIPAYPTAEEAVSGH